MPNTLTLGTASYYGGDYLTTDNTVFSAVTAGPNPVGVTFNFDDTVTIAGTGVTATGFNTKAGNDSFVINTTLTATTSDPAANKLIDLGSGNDIVKVNANVTGYNIQAGVGNDTLVISTGVTATNTVFSGSTGADLLVIQGTVIGGQIAATGGVSATNPNPATDGNDTIIFATGSSVSGVIVNSFSISNDTLIIGGTFTGDKYNVGTGTIITGSDFTAAGAVIGTALTSVTNTGSNADISVLNAWLAAGGNKITLI